MPRKGRAWTEYPSFFTGVMDEFRFKPEMRDYKLPCSKADAYTIKTQFYRFFDAIRYAYRTEDDPDARKHTGLEEIYTLANNLIPSAFHEPGMKEWFFRLRKTVVSDEIKRLSAADQQFLKRASKDIKKKRVEDDEAITQAIVNTEIHSQPLEVVSSGDGMGELWEELYGKTVKKND